MPDAVLHLVRRATWGPTPGLLEDVTRRGAEAWLEEQLTPATIDDQVCDRFLRLFPKLGRSIPTVRAQDPNGNYGVMQQLAYATIGRYCWSRRQLFEVVCDFWSNHLNVTCPVTAVWADRHDYDTEVVRRHAFGSFADMLVASSGHPSMLRYLDGATSQKANPNQNYGRELLELHTVGVDAGYSEDDVKAAARVMTGWALGKDGTSSFSAARHDPSAATVLGWSAPAHDAGRGRAVQESLLRHLAAHPLTARRLAVKLGQRFVADVPPESLVRHLADVYLDNDTAIVPVLRALFSSPEFAASAGQKTRRPLEGLVAAVRALGAAPGTDRFGGADVLFVMARGLGHAPLSWHAPNGYPDVAAAWVSAGSTMRRWNFVWQIAARRKPTNLTWPVDDPVLSALPPTWGEFLPRLVQRLLYRPALPAEVAALLQFCEKASSSPVSRTDAWLTTRLPDLLAMVLDAPGHMER